MVRSVLMNQSLEASVSSLSFAKRPREHSNQNQNSLLVKRQNDNTSPGDWPRKISP